MPVLLIQLPYGDPFLGQLPKEARDTIREDLKQYEKDYKIRLEIDPNTGTMKPFPSGRPTSCRNCIPTIRTPGAAWY